MANSKVNNQVVEKKKNSMPEVSKSTTAKVSATKALEVKTDTTKSTKSKPTQTKASSSATKTSVAKKAVASKGSAVIAKPTEVKAVDKNIAKTVEKPKNNDNIKKKSLTDNSKNINNPKTLEYIHDEKENSNQDALYKKKVLFVSSESHPFARTGGLGDVTSALPKELNKLNTDTRVIMPLYHDVPNELRSTFRYIGSVYVTLAWRYQYCGLFSTVYDGVTYYFIDNEQYFKRSGLYGHYDDAERFAFFSKAVLECLRLIDFYPDIIHCNDWQASLVPVFLDGFYRGYKEYKNIKTVFTIHNIEFQGRYGKQIIKDILGLPKECSKWVEYNDDANFMKGAIERASAVTTVSETYATEIMDRYFAYGLDLVLSDSGYKLKGIVNGIDTELFNPATDKALFANYSYENIELKKENKKGLLNMLGLEYNDKKPLIGMVTRLTEQKGIDLVASVLENIMSSDCQMIVLGTGDWKYESKLREFEERYPDKFKVIITFSTDLANKIYAGSDMFLMPSKFEPCGLSQMIAMRYGAVPIVRETGGLKDTVTPFNPIELSGKGFTFYSYSAYDMLDAIYRAIDSYRNKREWNAIVAEDMNADFSWTISAKKYYDLYNKL